MVRAHDLTTQQGATFTQLVRWGVLPVVFKPITAIAQTAPALLTVPLHGVPLNWEVAITGVKGMTAINAVNLPLQRSDYHLATVIDPNTIALPDVHAGLFQPYMSGGFLQYYSPQDLTGFTGRMSIKTSPIPLALTGIYHSYSLTHVGNRVALVTSGDPHGLSPGNILTVSGITGAGAATYNGTYQIASTPGPNSLTYISPNGLLDLTNSNAIGEPVITYGVELLRLDSATTGRITFDVANSVITLTIAALDTLALTWTAGFYDLDLVSPAGVVTTLLSGSVTVTPAVTTT
jgi:hypothetical protein